MRRHTLALTALSAAVTLAVGVPATASAQTWRHTDPAGDVTKYTYNLDTDEETETVDPTITNGDVIGSTIKHNPRKVIATMRFRDLVAPTSDLDAYVLSIKTNRLNRDLTVVATSDAPRGERQFSRPNGRDVRCRGLSHHIDYTANTVTMSVPRSCLGKPRWVKAGAASIRIANWDDVLEPVNTGEAPSDTPDAAVITQYLDDAHGGAIGDNIKYSPRLRRG